MLCYYSMSLVCTCVYIYIYIIYLFILYSIHYCYFRILIRRVCNFNHRPYLPPVGWRHICLAPILAIFFVYCFVNSFSFYDMVSAV